MMKSHSDSLLHVASAILTDCKMAYPQMRGLDRDISRLTLFVGERGLGVFTLDLPQLDSMLLQGLETGKHPSTGFTKYSQSRKVPRLFAGLYMLIFDDNLCLREQVDPTAIAFLRQLLCLGKKIAVPCSRKREFQAIKDYVDVERELFKPTLSWGSDKLTSDGSTNHTSLCDLMVTHLPLFPDRCQGGDERVSRLLERCQQVADILADEIGVYCPECVIDTNEQLARPLGLKHGPGAVAERGGRSFDKYRFTSWSPKLSTLFPFERMGRMPSDEDLSPLPRETPARLISVPKTAKGPRLIAAEPSEHMWCQKLTGSWLRSKIMSSKLGRYINFRKQELSGDLVLGSSLNRRLATIDLSSASDRLSCWVIERLLRRNPSLLNALHSHRTRWIHIPHTGEYLELKKFASQGTDVTFPIQSFAFLCFALGVSIQGRITEQKVFSLRNKVRVFGDDIIIPRYGYADMCAVLHAVQLKVNTDKSFCEGFFRESCGTDAYMGYDVTPCKPKTLISDSPASCQAVIDTANNLFYKGYLHASIQLERRLDRDSRKRFPLVGRDVGATGLVSYSFGLASRTTIGTILAPSKEVERELCSLFNPGRGFFGLRWNIRLCRYEVRIQAFRSRTKVRPFDCGYSGLLHRAVSPRGTNSIINDVSAAGVPERPQLSNQMRWEAIQQFL